MDSDLDIELGPLSLLRPLGRGGMGEVWHAVHRAQRVPVAVKLLFGRVTPEATLQFEREVAAIAGLSHPSVVRVVDSGVIDPRTAAGSSGHLQSGSRYLAMELASYGSASDHLPRTWSEARYLTVCLLDGLAHAHSRGMVHRDIKPGNLLLCSPLDAPDSVPEGLLGARPVLSDFGLTIAGGDSLDSMSTAGTPHYMAPEQVQGAVHRMGAWTDIYQVGVLLWRLVTGTPPITAPNPHAILFAHLQRRPGEFLPLYDVPDGLEEWLRTCLAKGIHERFAFAAEARDALIALGGADDAPGMAFDDAEQPTALTTRPLQAEPGDLTTALPHRREPWVPTTYAPTTPPPRIQLADTGLGLFALREVGPFGRDNETRLLWDALLDVQQRGGPRALVLRGARGVGRTRLSRWIGQTAVERGAAQHFELAWDVRDPQGSMRRLLEHLLLVRGVPPAEQLDAAEPVLASIGRETITAQAKAALSEEGIAIAAMRSLLVRLLDAWSGAQAIVVSLHLAGDDPEGLRLARRLLAQEGMGRVLLVLTATEPVHEGLQGVEAAFTGAGGEILRVGPLENEAQLELLRALGDFGVRLEEAILRATSGIPGALFEQLAYWIQQGSVVPGPDGFRPQGRLEVRPLTDARWTEAVQQLRPDDAQREGLEVAAALGTELDRDEWRRAVARLGGSTGPAEALLRRTGLILERPGSEERLVFAHPTVVEALQPPPERASQVHAAIAQALSDLGRSGERVAEHYMAAHDPASAYRPLYEAICTHLDRGESRSQHRIELLTDCVEALRLPPTDARWGDLWMVLAWQNLSLNQLEKAEIWARRAAKTAQERDWPAVSVRALRMTARIQESRGEVREALATAEQALALAERHQDVSRAASLYYLVGRLARQLRESDRAQEHLERALEIARAGRLVRMEVASERDLAELARDRGDLQAARDHLRTAAEKARDARLHDDLAVIENSRGEVARKAGALGEARRAYAEALRIFAELGLAQLVDPVLNLALMEIQAGEHRAAHRRVYRYLGTRVRDDDTSILQLFIRVVLVACTTHMGDRLESQAHTRWIQRFLDGSTLADPDVATCLEVAADGARASGDVANARDLYRLALEHLKRLGRLDDARALRDRVTKRS